MSRTLRKETGYLLFEAKAHPDFLEITFHAPAAANALGLADARELAALVKKYARWTKPVVVRSRHPTVFCAGGNLSDHAALARKAEGLRANAEIRRALDAFQRWPVIKLAVVDGRAIGGGVEWLARFDVRWATENAEFSFRQKRVGLSFGWGGGAAWARWLGEARTRQLLLEARPLDAAAAQRLGVIDRALAKEKIDAAVASWAREISGPIDQVLCTWSVRTEARLFTKLWWGEAHRSALAKWRARSSKS